MYDRSWLNTTSLILCRCGHGEKMFHVETTAWEGEHAYETPDLPRTEEPQAKVSQKDATNTFANYANYFWSKK